MVGAELAAAGPDCLRNTPSLAYCLTAGRPWAAGAVDWLQSRAVASPLSLAWGTELVRLKSNLGGMYPAVGGGASAAAAGSLSPSGSTQRLFCAPPLNVSYSSCAVRQRS